MHGAACLSRHGHASGLSFSWTRTNADAAGQDLWNIRGGGSGGRGGQLVSRCCFIQEAEY